MQLVATCGFKYNCIGKLPDKEQWYGVEAELAAAMEHSYGQMQAEGLIES